MARSRGNSLSSTCAHRTVRRQRPPPSLRDDPSPLSTLSSRIRTDCAAFSRTRRAACPRCPSGWCAPSRRRARIGQYAASAPHPASATIRVHSTLSSRHPHRLRCTRRAACPRCPSGWCARDQRRGGRTSSSPVSVDLRVPRAWRPAVVVVLSTADGVQLPSGPHARDTRSSTEPAERASRRLAARCAAASRHVRAGAVLVLPQVPHACHNHRSCRCCVYMSSKPYLKLLLHINNEHFPRIALLRGYEYSAENQSIR